MESSSSLHDLSDGTQKPKESIRQTELDKYLEVFRDVTKINAFDHSDNLIVEEDTLKQLQQKYPDSFAFSTQEPSCRILSLNERLLEHSLEDCLNKKQELTEKRKLSYRNKIPSLSKLSGSTHETPRYFRSKREEYIEKKSKIPELGYPILKAKLYQKKVNLSLKKRNTREYVQKLVENYYQTRLSELKLHKYKVLYRWNRQTQNLKILDRSATIFQKRMESISREFDFIRERISVIRNEYFKNFNENRLSSSDFENYLRNLTTKISVSKKIDHLSKKISMLSFSDRFSMFNKSIDFFNKRKDPPVPLIIVDTANIDSQLSELKECFDLKNLTVDGGEEFLFTIKKRFNAVFIAQANMMKFNDYPIHEIGKTTDQFFLDVVAKDIQKSQNVNYSLNKIYLKKVNEEEINKFNELEFQINLTNDRQKKQNILLDQIPNIDTNLQIEINFLKEGDVGYARKRLEECVNNHYPKAFVQENKRKIVVDGGKATLNKLFSVYMLRYIRIREFRKKLLDTLNYFHSIKRRILLDEMGLSIKDSRKNSFISLSFPEFDDLESFDSDFIMKSDKIRPRDDMYFIENGRSLLIKDSNGIFVIYSSALCELEKREQFLLKLGSHFIIKSSSEDNVVDVDRTLILEDLYESETWYQDGKKKVIDRYFEAYEHSVNPCEQKNLGKIILELIASEPEIDLSSNYFSESYASEIIGLELHYSLLKDVIQVVINDEKDQINLIYKYFENRDHVYGYPFKLVNDKSKSGRFSTKLLANSPKIGFLDFYQSIPLIGKIYYSIKKSFNNFVQSFSIKNSIVISTIKRLVIQKSLIEWKLLAEEEKIQELFQLKYSEERKKIEDDFLLKDAEAIIGIINNVYQKSDKDLNMFSGSESSTETEGSFQFKDEEIQIISPQKAQLFANSIEMIITRKNLVDQLFKTDLLKNIYYKQCQILSKEKIEKLTKILSIKANNFSNLAIEEFEKSMAQFNFSSHEGIEKSIFSVGLTELRHAFQYQLTHRILFKIVVKYNQILLDNYVISQNDETFITSFKETVITKKMVEQNMLAIEDFIEPHLDRIKKEYSTNLKNITNCKEFKVKESEILKFRVREIQCNLSKLYCYEMTKSMYSHVQKIQIIEYLQKIKRVLRCVKENDTYIIGKPGDEITQTVRAYKEIGIKKPVCMMTSDGNIVSPFYIPHFIQIMKMQSLILDTSGSRELFTNMFKLVYNNFLLLLFLSIKSQMKRKKIDIITQNQIDIEEMKKIEAQMNSIKECNSSSKVESFFKSTINILHKKCLITLERLKIKFLSEDNYVPIKYIEKEIIRLTSLKKKRTKRFFMKELWVPLNFISSSKYEILKSETFENEEIYNIYHTFLLELNSSERNYFIAEDLKFELELDEILNEQKKTVYSTTNSETAVSIQQDYSKMVMCLLQLKKFFFIKARANVKKMIKDNQTMENIYVNVITKEADRLYDRSIQNYNDEIKETYLGTGETSKLKFREKNKTELLQKKILLIKQHVNKLLIVETVKKIKEQCSILISDLKLGGKIDISKEENFLRIKNNGKDGKINKFEMFREFLYNIMKRGVLNKNKSSATTITMLQRELEDAIDQFATKLSVWKNKEIEFIQHNCEMMINRYKRIAFLNRQKFEFSKYNHLIDKQSFKRRIEAEVADKNFDLVFRVATVDRVNQNLTKKLNSIKEIAKEEVKKEYNDLVRELYKEMLKVNQKYKSYKNKFYSNLQSRFKQVKEDAILRSKKKPSLFRKGAIDVVNCENKLEKFKNFKINTELFETKLKVMYQLKIITMKGKFERKIQELEDIIEEKKKTYWGKKAKSEERENLLRQELVKTQNELSNSQMEVERLKKNLDAQKKNKREFTQWKLKNKQVIDELYKKVQRLEKWNSYNLDIEKLLLEKENLGKEVKKYSKLKEKMNKQSRLIEARKDAKVKDLGRKLQTEKKLKERAFKKINEIISTKEGVDKFEQRYYDSMSEISILKNILRDNNIPIPSHVKRAVRRIKSSLPLIKTTTVSTQVKKKRNCASVRIPITYIK